MAERMTVAAFDAALANGAYAWPGGYPLRFVMDDGESLCFPCAKREAKLIRESLADDVRDGWKPAACEVLWEGAAESCSHCGALIESAYGEESAL